jgi:hypothetical protein
MFPKYYTNIDENHTNFVWSHTYSCDRFRSKTLCGFHTKILSVHKHEWKPHKFVCKTKQIPVTDFEQKLCVGSVSHKYSCVGNKLKNSKIVWYFLRFINPAQSFIVVRYIFSFRYSTIHNFTWLCRITRKTNKNACKFMSIAFKWI